MILGLQFLKKIEMGCITDEELDDFGIVDPVSRDIIKYRYSHAPKGFYPNPWVALQ